MDNWLFPLSIFLLAFIIWIIAIILVPASNIPIFHIGSGILAGIGILLLFQRGYVGLAGVLVCVYFLIGILIASTVAQFTQEKIPKQGIFSQFIGKEGKCLTALEPKGKVQIDGVTISATTEGLFLAEGQKIRVVRSSAKLVVVEKIG